MVNALRIMLKFEPFYERYGTSIPGPLEKE